MRKSMKKLFTIALVLFVTCKLFAVDGVVTFVKGKVEVNRNNKWIALKVGDKVSESEVINTGFQSEAKVKLMNNILYLGPVTRVTLSSLSSNEERDKVNVYLSTGIVRSKVNRTDTKRVSYTVRTPIAVASVRGTDFDSKRSAIQVRFGKVLLVPAETLDNADLGNKNSQDNEEEKKKDENKDEEKSLKQDTETSGASTTEDKEDLNPAAKAEADKKAKEDKAKNNSEIFEDDKGFADIGSMLGANDKAKVTSGSTMTAPQKPVQTTFKNVTNKVSSASTKEAAKPAGPISTTSVTVSNEPTIPNAPAPVVPTNGGLNINVTIPTGNVEVEVKLPSSIK